MKNSPAYKIISILLLLLMCGGIVVSVTFYLKLQQSNLIIKDLNARLATSRDSNQIIIEALKNNAVIIAALQHDSMDASNPPKYISTNGYSKPSVLKPTVSESKRQLSNILKRASAIENSVYEVAIYSYGCPATHLQKATDYFIGNGYQITDTASLNQLPDWLSRKPAVIYYGENNQRKANAVAEDLKKITDLPFQTQQGAGFGVSKEAQPYTFKIHLIR